MSEKKGGSERVEAQMQKFVDVIDECGLLDVEVSGPFFTWRRGDLLERLDRSLINQDAADLFPRIHELHVDARASDRIPIILYTNGLLGNGREKRKFVRRFQFKGFWSKEKDYGKIIKQNWSDGGGIQVVRNNLKLIEKALGRWSRDTFGNIPRQIIRLNNELQIILFDSTDIVAIEKRKIAQEELRKLMEYEEQMWRQKSRITWLSEGDQNTKFFHGFAKARGRRNRVGRILDMTGNWQETSVGIQEAFINYFQGLLLSEGCNHMDLVLDSIPQKVSVAMNKNLCRSFGRDEIECALKQMASDKAPGEDGFLARFYQQYWHVVGDDISEVCLKVLNEAAELNEINHSLIALIPKIENPQQVTDFRPISLCNVIYKLISKTIVNRMKAVLPEVISQYQSAFVPGRCIHDNVITAFEVIHSIKAKLAGDVPHCVLKLDIMGRITPSRGLRQGDPLSPYLFLMVSEGLTGLFQKADREGLIHGVKAAVEAPVISHLLFADDCLLFSRAHLQEVIHIKQCLLLYESAAGQKINFQKSVIAFGPGISDQNKAELSQMLGVPIVECHERYLGLPTMAGRSKKSLFRGIDKRLESHLQGWQSKLLSKAGKFVLVKAVAQAILVYSINKKDGGLGFRDLEVFNQALLAKTVWRIVLCPDSMVNKVIRAKYVGNGDWAAAGICVKPSQVWRGLVWGKELLCAGIRWRVSSGESVKIWGDKWLPAPWSFKVVTPCFMDPNATVNLLMNFPGMWNTCYINQYFLPVDVDKILVVPLCDGSRRDVDVWHFNENDRYSVKSGYWFGMELRRLEEGSSSDVETRRNLSFIVCGIVRWLESYGNVAHRGSVREREEVSENGEDGNNNLSEQVATLFFDGACDSKAGMAGLGAIIMSGSVNVIHVIGQSGLDLSDIGGVMDAVCSLKSEFEWISWKHVRKRKNQIAHTLARRALKMDQALLCFDSGPP
ncbi:hypothetical protein ACLB2K_031112 [Fragaria x ananassa]